MLVHGLSHDVAKGQPSRGSGENHSQNRGRSDGLCRGPIHRPQHSRTHTFSVKIVQCEIGTHMVDRCASRSLQALHRAAAGFAGRHNAILEFVRPLEHFPRWLCPLPRCGDSSEMPPDDAFEWTVLARILRERIAPLPGKATPSCQAMTEPTREFPSSFP